jgi:hypothetical protein
MLTTLISKTSEYLERAEMMENALFKPLITQQSSSLRLISDSLVVAVQGEGPAAIATSIIERVQALQQRVFSLTP